MRFNELKKSLNEAANKKANAGLESQHAMHDLDAIAKAVPDMSTANRAPFVKNLQAIAQKVRDFVTKHIDTAQPQNLQQQPQQQQPNAEPARQTNDPNATVEAVGDVQNKLGDLNDIEQQNKDAEAALQMLRDDIAKIAAADIDEAMKANFLVSLNATLDANVKSSETLRAARDTARAERDEAVTFVKEVTGILVTLGNKVQGYTVYSDDELASMDSRDRASYKKSSTNAEKFTKTLKQALFGKILDMQEGSDVTQEEIKDFLQACVDGKVLNMLALIQQSSGNVKDHVNPEYQKVFDVFVKENIFSYSPGTTSGAIGPGEMALSMMGNPAEKGKKGDLKIGDQEVEIKASAATGGRLNSKAIAKATTGWAVWSKNIAEILADAPKDRTIGVGNKKGQIEQVPLNKWNGNQYNYNKNTKKSKEGSRYNWNSKGFDALNAEVLQPYSDFDKTYKLFKETIESLVQNIGKIPSADKWHTWLANSIEQDGTVDLEKVSKVYTRIAYESYNKADGITTLMLLRTTSLDYVIVQDGKELSERLGGDGDIVMGGGFNWNDDQQTPTPGYVPKK